MNQSGVRLCPNIRMAPLFRKEPSLCDSALTIHPPSEWLMVYRKFFPNFCRPSQVSTQLGESLVCNREQQLTSLCALLKKQTTPGAAFLHVTNLR